ncbi:MAG TPA: ABC transporter permease subunit [Pirellulales bacterium]|nr:ABC transporter permease subunit [Pirellulales bacterium]
MRAYLAIIKDSFREALASRVLWILLVLNTLVLAALAPFGIVERTGIAFAPNDVTDAKGLIEKIKRQSADPQSSPGKQIWALLSDRYKSALEPSDDAQTRAWAGMIYVQLPGELNEVLASRNLYDEAAWSGISLTEETRELLGQGVDRLDEEDVSRLNRLLLEAAYPDEIAASREKSAAVSYFTWRLPAIPLTKKTLVDTAVNTFINLFVGVVGVFAGVLVTASIIPQTYAPGAIDLLLSKPISRSLLYLTKYFGGCMFILINAAYVIGGLWLIAGLRLGQWSNRLLLCIPVFLFLFAVYYAVSGLAGVVWRNAIVSVVIAVLFWAACFVVGATKNIVESVFLNSKRLVKLVSAGDGLISVNDRAEIFHWSAAKSDWERILSGGAATPFGPAMTLPLVGPVYDAKHERLVALPVAMPQFGFMPADNSLLVGEKQEEWKRQEGTPAPAGTAALLIDSQGTLLAVTPHGLLKLVGEPTATEKSVKLFGFAMPAPGGGRFVSCSSELRLGTPLAAAIDRTADEVAIYDTETLHVLSPDAKGRYVVRASREIEGNRSGLVAIGGGRVLLASANGDIRLFDSAKLEPQGEFRPQGSNPPRFADVSPDGKLFAVLFHNRRLWLYDAASARPLRLSVSGQGDISAAAFATNDSLIVADRFTRVTEYQLSTGKIADRRRPSLSMLEKVYLFAIKPIYTVFPKPGEMDNVVNYLLTGSESVSVGMGNDLRISRPQLDIWGPIWSNLAFIAVVVGLGCLYTHRKDF